MTDSPFERGKALAKEGRFEEALPLLEAATRERSEAPNVWLALAACYFRVERHDEFREAIRKGLSLDPEHAPTKRFLRQITGTDVIPAQDTGRPRVVMEEPPDTHPAARTRDREEAETKTGGGCLAGASVLSAILVLLAALLARG